MSGKKKYRFQERKGGKWVRSRMSTTRLIAYWERSDDDISGDTMTWTRVPATPETETTPYLLDRLRMIDHLLMNAPWHAGRMGAIGAALKPMLEEVLLKIDGARLLLATLVDRTNSATNDKKGGK